MTSGGTPFTRTSCSVVGSVVPVSVCSVGLGFAGVGELILTFLFTVHKLDYHGPEEGEHDHHH